MRNSLFNSVTGRKTVLIRWKRIQQNQLNFLNKKRSGFTENLIKLHAYLSSDGWVGISKEKSGKIRYSISFYPDISTMAKDFVETFKSVYGVQPSIKKYGNYYNVAIRNKIAYFHLKKLGSYNSLEWKVPLKLLKTEKEKVLWLRLFFDCEGYVGRKVIQVQSVNLRGIREIQNLLTSLSIESKIYRYARKNKNWNINYILSIMKLGSRKVYLNKIGFNHAKKKEKLENYIRNAEVGQLGGPVVSN